MQELRDLVAKEIALYEKTECQNDIYKLKKLKIIAEIFEDDGCFFKMKREDALNVLEELGINNYEDYYKKLINYSEFQKNIENFNI